MIPHGTAWGIYTPAGSSWDKQLPGNDPGLQRLVELYSGHGNSEEYRDWRAVEVRSDGSPHCTEPGHGYTASCWRSGELVRMRCLELGESPEERAQVEGRHGRYYLDLVQELAPTMGTRQQVQTLRTVAAERANIRAAWAWARCSSRAW